jgi:hypothetical protein
MKKIACPHGQLANISDQESFCISTTWALHQGRSLGNLWNPLFSSNGTIGGFFMESGRFMTKGLFVVLFVFFMFPSPVGADAIVLRNGNRIEAKRVWEEDGNIKCDQYGGVVGFPKREVLRIEQQQSDDQLDGVQKKVPFTEKIKVNPEKVILSKLHKLYLELMSFKDDSLFHKVGFTPENKYSNWLDRVGKLNEDPRSKTLLKKGISVEDLLKLGLEYFKSGGKETSFSRFANGEFRKAFDL